MRELAPMLLPNLVLFVLVAGIIVRRFTKSVRGRISVIEICVLILLVLSIRGISKQAERAWSLEEPSVAVFEQAALQADAVVVLTAGIEVYDEQISRTSSESLLRGLRAVAIANEFSLPLVISGGIGGGSDGGAGISEAEALAQDLNTHTRVILETASTSTAENAANTREILVAEGLERVILVTSRLHSRRAVASLRAAGIDVIAYAAATPPIKIEGTDYLPLIGNVADWSRVNYEIVGSLFYLAKGRVGIGDLFRGLD